MVFLQRAAYLNLFLKKIKKIFFLTFWYGTQVIKSNQVFIHV